VFDLTAYGVTGQPTFVSDIDCLAIDGNKAWFSTTVRSSSNPSAFPVGFRGLGAIEDLPDGDLIFSGPGSYEAFGLTCADKPAIALTFAVPALNGNFTVR
jgi:hypothetical protein